MSKPVRALPWTCPQGHVNTYVTGLRRVLPYQLEGIKGYLKKGYKCHKCKMPVIPESFGELIAYDKYSNLNRKKT